MLGLGACFEVKGKGRRRDTKLARGDMIIGFWKFEQYGSAGYEETRAPQGCCACSAVENLKMFDFSRQKAKTNFMRLARDR